MTRTRYSGSPSTPCGRRSPPRRKSPSRWVSRTSGKQWCSGTGEPSRRLGPPSCGRIDGPPSAVRSYVRRGSKACCGSTPASWRIRTSPLPSWSGCCGITGSGRRAGRGELAAGTIESWLVAKLTGGRIHVSDHTNASRTLLYDIRSRDWDADLLALFDVPREVLPSLTSSSQVVGESDSTHLGFSIPIGGLAGDQQAALFGQGCVDAGLAKNTYGTGAFLLVLAGSRPPVPARGLLATVACGPGESRGMRWRGAYSLPGPPFSGFGMA